MTCRLPGWWGFIMASASASHLASFMTVQAHACPLSGIRKSWKSSSKQKMRHNVLPASRLTRLHHGPHFGVMKKVQINHQWGAMTRRLPDWLLLCLVTVVTSCDHLTSCTPNSKAVTTQIYILKLGDINMDALVLLCTDWFHSFMNREQILEVHLDDDWFCDHCDK